MNDYRASDHGLVLRIQCAKDKIHHLFAINIAVTIGKHQCSPSGIRINRFGSLPAIQLFAVLPWDNVISFTVNEVKSGIGLTLAM